MMIELIRKKIQKSGEGLNELSRNSDVDVAVLWRIMHGGDCKTVTADLLLSYFRLTIAPKDWRKRKARQGP